MDAARKIVNWPAPLAIGTAAADPSAAEPSPFNPLPFNPLPSMTSFASELLSLGLLSPHQLLQWRGQSAAAGTGLIRFLVSRRIIDTDVLYDLLARTWSSPRLDPTQSLADPGLLDRIGAHEAIRLELLPWRRQSGTTLIVVADPEEFHRHRTQLTAAFGPVSMALAPWSVIEAAIHTMRGAELAWCAETAAPAAMSSRSFDPTTWGPVLGLAVLGLAFVAIAAPGGLLLFAFVLVQISAVGFNLLKLATLVLDLFRPEARPAPELADGDLPVITLLIPLYKEEAVARKLVRRIGVLDYPAEKLDIILIVEDDDATTRRTLELADLGPSMRVLSVPEGAIRTKPRALNYAMDQARGEIVGIYDAEDAPAADHLRRIAARFAQADGDLACIQGVLDFYNPRHNWLSRCFTVEYAAWFRVLLPGIARLGLVVPLGGTTLFMRRNALDAMGRWDAHNVTEDADLGLRIARAGMRTELMAIITMEEANSRAIPWIKQRSRWIKGFMMTWLAHHRDPARLWRDLGAWRFIGLQVTLLGSVVQALLAPLMWSLWLVPFGIYHPLQSLVPSLVFDMMFFSFICVELMLLLIGLRALDKTEHRLSPIWVPTMILYYPLATAAAWKAAWELFRNPHYWDKTSHGGFSPDQTG